MSPVVHPTATDGLVERLCDAGALERSDLQVADILVELWSDPGADPRVRLAAALGVRAPWMGHVCCDLALVADTVTTEASGRGRGTGQGSDALSGLSWPDPAAWCDVLATSDLVTVAQSDTDAVGVDGKRPFVLHGTRLYLQRLWSQEAEVAGRLGELAGSSMPSDGAEGIAAALLPGDAASDQRAAVARSLARRLGVIAGGPGTGKTTTIAALLVAAVATAGDQPLRVVLAAPTGKAAARVNEALGDALRRFAASPPPELGDVLPRALEMLEGVEATTLHRLLGAGGGPTTSLAHHRGFPLPYDVIVVDEASMVALPLMAHLLDALGDQSRLVLVGDPHQLASVEAGSVLADIVGPGGGIAGSVDGGPPSGGALAGVVTLLRQNFRFAADSGIGALATAVNAGDLDAVRSALQGGSGVEWHDADAERAEGRTAVLDAVEEFGAAVVAAARSGDAPGALEALGRCQLLCAHRQGPHGVEQWNALVGARLQLTSLASVGRPVLVTRNDPALGVYNGDVGVEVVDDDRVRIVFPGVGDGAGDHTVRRLAPVQLEHVETAHALTIHKSQGSEFDEVVVVLPPAASRLASRELLYTAVTRARRRVVVVGTAESVSAAVQRRLKRQGGLADRLWGTHPPD